MVTLYQTTKDTKTLEIEESDREGQPFRIVLTLKKLGVVTMLDYFVSTEEAEEIVRALSR